MRLILQNFSKWNLDSGIGIHPSWNRNCNWSYNLMLESESNYSRRNQNLNWNRMCRNRPISGFHRPSRSIPPPSCHKLWTLPAHVDILPWHYSAKHRDRDFMSRTTWTDTNTVCPFLASIYSQKGRFPLALYWFRNFPQKHSCQYNF